MKRNGFTLVEILAAIAVIAIISVIAAPSIIKSYNNSRIEAITIQKSKLVEAGDIFLDDYCRDAISSEYKEKCNMYYQKLKDDAYNSNTEDVISSDKEYNFICVDDIKKLDYYTEELKFGGTECHGVIVYEIDKQTKMQSDSFSYVECGDVYPVEKTDRDIKLRALFDKCFPKNGINGGPSYDVPEEKTYTLTIKYVENDLNGRQVKPQKVITLSSSDYDKSVITSFVAENHMRDNNTYEAVVNTGGQDIEFVNLHPSKDSNGNKTFEITKLPKQNLTITVVYSVEQHKLVTNYYRYDPSSIEQHSNVVMNSKNQSIIIGYTGEGHTLSIPEFLNDDVNGKTEKFFIKNIYLNGVLQGTSFSNDISIGLEDKIVDVIYQREEFNIKYENEGGTGCSTGRVKYEGKYGSLCNPSRTGYTFDGWSLSVNGTIINADDEFNIYNDITLYANWTPITYTITYHLNNGSQGSGAVYNYNIETSTFNLPTPSRTNYQFLGWYENSSLSGNTISKVTKGSYGNKNYYASWAGCTDGTLKYDQSKGYICVKNRSSENYSYECGTYACGSYACGSYACGSYQCGTQEKCVNCNCGWYLSSDGIDRIHACGTCCSTEPKYCTSYCTSYCTDYCTDYCTGTNYYCPSGWSNYTGSGSSLTCYKNALR